MIVSKATTKDPEKLINILEKYKITRLVLVPTLLRSILLYLSLENNKQQHLSHLKIWVCSGESLSMSLATEFFDYFEEGKHVLCNFYGSTEIMGDVTYFVCETKKQLDYFEKIPIGIAVHNTIIYILDKNLRPVKEGEIGELFVSGLNLARGYVKGRDPEKFTENPATLDTKYARLYRTGDFASVKKGIIFYEGRTDSQIKIRGHRVDLSEVEKITQAVDGIEKAVVLCHNVGELDQTLVAFVTLNENCSLTTDEIESVLKTKMVEYMIPQVVILESIPLLVNGKVDRQTLLKMFKDSTVSESSNAVDIKYDFEGVPEHKLATAEQLFEIIADVIGKFVVKNISINSNFYDLGGNSLNSIYTVTELRKKGYFISITDFIKAKDLKEILGKIETDHQLLSNDLLVHDKNMIKSMPLRAVQLADEHKDDTIE